MVTDQSSNTLSTIADPEVAYQQSLIDKQAKPNTINAFSINFSNNNLEETRKGETVHSDWRNKSKSSTENEEHRKAILEMLELFQTM